MTKEHIFSTIKKVNPTYYEVFCMLENRKDKKDGKNDITMRAVSIILCVIVVVSIISGCHVRLSDENSERKTIASETVSQTSEETSVITEKMTSSEKSSASEESMSGQNKTETESQTSAKVNPAYAIEGAVPQSERVDGSFFDDTVFVGDSISLKLKYYETSYDELGKAQFVTAGSMSADNLLRPLSDTNSVHPEYNGQKMLLEDVIPLTGAKKMYIMLGMNDIGLGIDDGIAHYKKVINNVLAKSPDVKIFVQSVTPRAQKSTKPKSITNEKISQYNHLLSQMCKENNWYFVDVASVMYDDSGYLKEEYCSDLSGMGMHFTNSGCKAWADYLLTHTVK